MSFYTVLKKVFLKNQSINGNLNNILCMRPKCSQHMYFDIFLSFGMWTTSAPCGREGDSVTLTTSGLCVFCVIRRSQQNRPGNAPPSENWEQPLAWLTLVLSSNQFDQGLLRTKCSDEYITFFHSLIHACDGIMEWGKFSLCTRNSSFV